MNRPTFALIATAAVCASALPASAQTAPDALGPRLQDARISGHGSTITIRRLPVRTPEGVVYRDITIELKLDASGAVSADAAGSPLPSPGHAAVARPAATAVIAHEVSVGKVTETETPPEVAAAFTPGLYRDDRSGGIVNLIRGRHDMQGDFPSWSLTAVSGENVIGSAEWYGGPLRLNPHQALIERAHLTNDAYSYGVMTSSGPGDFDNGMLIGAVEKGTTLTVVSFHKRGCCTYSDTPTSAIVYTLVHAQ